jgi:hypothetical protein
MRTILLLVLLAACGGGDDAHDVVMCETSSGYPANSRCERACAAGPACAANDAACLAALPACTTARGACPTDKIAAFDGGHGCCADLLDDDKLNTPVFVECIE